MTAGVLPIALDAMGGDNAPREIVRGAAQGARQLGVRVTLVGRRSDIERELDALPAEDASTRGMLDIVDAPQVIAMGEHPAQAVRAKKDASLVVACQLVGDGRARAAVSAGNSGAVLAAALFAVRRVRGIARPAIGTSMPTQRGDCFVLDVGANAECRPEWLAQFAVMGSVYAKTMMGIADPSVALLSNGEEEGKGSELVKAAAPLLRSAPVRFIGNVEGKDIFAGAADVVVTDGFTGNVALKMAEGVAEYLFTTIGTIARASLTGKVGGLLLKPKLRPIRDRVDYRRTGGALLLGVGGEVVIAHGRSDALAITNALRVADTAAKRDVHGTIAAQLGALAGDDGAADDGDTAESVPAAAEGTEVASPR